MTPCPKPYREHLTRAQFKRRAQEVFERDNYRDQYTGEYLGPDGPLHCHHRVFKSQGGDDQIDNLATCGWETHYKHGDLKDAKLITEFSYAKINELKKRYAI